MYLDESDQISYLANIISFARADGELSATVAAALDEIRTTIGAKKSVLDAAIKRVSSESALPIKLGSFAAQVCNLADMLYVAVLEGDLTASKKRVITEFSNIINLTDEQRMALSHDAIERVKSQKIGYVCPTCGATISRESNYCPKCGAGLATISNDAEPSIPATGYTIEFCESTAANFPFALKVAKDAESLATFIRHKKTWYLASWPLDRIRDAAHLAAALSGIRNKRCYRDGAEIDWDQLFGFVWCAEQRNKAYRPAEYCFGRSDNQINPWGCKQARLNWLEWADWFSYGHFEKHGVLRGKRVWVFDKQRIRHELLTNLQKVRFCPHLRTRLIESALQRLPDQVEVVAGGLWKYSHSYQEVPGSIKVTEVNRSDGMEFKEEYFADGVRPRDLRALSELLAHAFRDAGVADIKPSDIAG